MSFKPLLLVSATAVACFTPTSPEPTSTQDAKAVRAWHPDAEWRAQWHSGKAEITRYALTKARYGELREGEAILIFVTEDLHPETHVKYDGEDRDAVGAVPVLKLNRLDRFTTGVYDYQMMMSVFTPEAVAENPRSLKIAASSQEWCGHVWLQANLAGDAYRYVGHSYFEGEADQGFTTKGALHEDELWTRLRIDPDSIPSGNLRVIPGCFDSRLAHYVPRAEAARITFEDDSADADMRICDLRYEAGRRLTIRFEKARPHRIESWEESSMRGGSRLSTSAVRTHRKLLPYWKHNKRADDALRRELGLR